MTEKLIRSLDDGFADNTQIETSADAILDFTK